MQIKKRLARFGLDTYVLAMGIWIVAIAGGIYADPAFEVIATITIAGLKTWLRPVLIDFFHMDGPQKTTQKLPPKPIVKTLILFGLHLLGTGASFFILLWLVNQFGIPVVKDPLLLGLEMQILSMAAMGLKNLVMKKIRPTKSSNAEALDSKSTGQEGV